MHPTMLVGLALALVGFLLFAGTLFGGGGVAKSQQFRVIGEVMSGRQGPGPSTSALTRGWSSQSPARSAPSPSANTTTV